LHYIENEECLKGICDDHFLFTFALKFEKCEEVVAALKATLPADNDSSLEATNSEMDFVAKVWFMWAWRRTAEDRATYAELKHCFRSKQQLITFIWKYGNLKHSNFDFSAQKDVAIREAFAILCAQILCSFEQQSILITDLLHFLQRCALHEDAEPLIDSLFPKSHALADVFCEIYKHSSWINHRLLKRIVDEMGDQNAKSLVEIFQKYFVPQHILSLSLLIQSSFYFNVCTFFFIYK